MTTSGVVSELPAYGGRRHREVLRLAHVETAVQDLDVAAEFYVELLGLRLAARTEDALYLRAPEEFDCWSLKLTARDDSSGLICVGFRVEADEDLDALAERHARLGIATNWLEPGEEIGHGRALRVVTPGGHPVEFVSDVEEISAVVDGEVRLPGRRGTPHGAAPTRLDHVNLRTPAFAAALPYWVETLGFSVSEYRTDPDGAADMTWLRRTCSSHDVALGLASRTGIHHVAYVVDGRDALSQAADVLADAGMQAQIEFGPGRHGTTNAYFLYIKDPFGNRIELYHGDYLRDLDRPPIQWSAEEYNRHGRLWWGQAPPASFADAQPVVDLSGDVALQ